MQGRADPYTVALYILRFLLANNSKGGKKGPFYGDVSLAHIPGASQRDEDARRLQEASGISLDLHWMVGAPLPPHCLWNFHETVPSLAADILMCCGIAGVITKNTLQAAEASRVRWKAGRPVSVLDGVPFAAKDNTVVQGFPARSGTIFHRCAALLRRSGAFVYF